MGYIIFYIIFAVITQYLTYKWIRKIDKKERAKLQSWETDYIIKTNEMIKHFKEENKMKKEDEAAKELEEAPQEENVVETNKTVTE